MALREEDTNVFGGKRGCFNPMLCLGTVPAYRRNQILEKILEYDDHFSYGQELILEFLQFY